MCDNKFSILKDFRLRLEPFKASEQMFIEDSGDVDMYFKFLIKESDDSDSKIEFVPEDNAHGTLILTIKKGSGVRRTRPIKIGTYGKKSSVAGENTGLYVSFEVMPVQSNGKLTYQTNVQYQIKGGE